jgi:GH15 family glucan-1,4-alpha-glucosidase
VRIYIEQGGVWKDKHWRLLQNLASYTCNNWQLPDSGIWELPQQRHFVAGKVMSWVVLERAIHIAELTGRRNESEIKRWRQEMRAIYAEIISRGWHSGRNSFVQCYESDSLDAATLLIPLMGFLPIDDPRVSGTIAAIEGSFSLMDLYIGLIRKPLSERASCHWQSSKAHFCLLHFGLHAP